MEQRPFSRTELLIGADGLARLAAARVAVFGLGGVGGYAVEALARSGVGTLDLIDNDKVCVTNINRQIIATRETIGQYKVDAAKARILSINPDAAVNVYRVFYMPDTAGQFDFGCYDYIVDAIDTVTGKLELILQADRAGTPIISSMGAGNKLDASAFRVADIYDTRVCPLAKVMRRELKKRGIGKLKVVYSEETPIAPRGLFPTAEGLSSGAVQAGEAGTQDSENAAAGRRQTPGSIAFVPSVAGLILAGEVVKDIIGKTED